MKTFLLSLVLVAQALTTGLDITVVDTDRAPVEGLHLTLTTYTYDKGEAVIRETITCETDSQGACTLLLVRPEQGGMQRGSLRIGEHGTRDLIWPGGMLSLVIPLEQVGFGREAAPYDFQREDGGVPVRKRAFPVYALLMGAFLLLLFSQIYRYAKTQEKNQ